MKLTWILVADNARARIFTASTPSSALEEIEGLVHTEGRLRDYDMTTDLPGRIKNADGSGHAFEQATDPKKHEADNFARHVAQHVEAGHNSNKFEQLLIIAEPTFLGLVRKHLPDHIKTHVCFELDKNLTMQSIVDIRNHLPQYLPTL